MPDDRSTRRNPRFTEYDRQELEEYATLLETALFNSEMSVIRARGDPAAEDRCRAAREDGKIFEFVQGAYDE